MWRVDLEEVFRAGESREWYTEDGELTGVDYPGYTPRTIRTCTARRTGFRLTAEPGRFGDKWAIAFAPEVTA